MAPEDRVYRLLRLPMRVLSLRTIVVISALAVVVTVITLGTWVWIGVTNEQYSQLDRRLDSVSGLGDISSLLSSAQQTTAEEPMPDGSLVRTARVARHDRVGAQRHHAAPVRQRLRQHHDQRRRVPGADLHGWSGHDRARCAGGRGPTSDRRPAPAGAADLRWRHRRHRLGRVGDVADHDQPVPAAGPAGARHQCPVQSRRSPGPRGARGRGDRRSRRGDAGPHRQ